MGVLLFVASCLLALLGLAFALSTGGQAERGDRGGMVSGATLSLMSAAAALILALAAGLQIGGV